MRRSWHRGRLGHAACHTDWLMSAHHSGGPDAWSHPSPAPHGCRLLQPVLGAPRYIPSPSSPALSSLLSRIRVLLRTPHQGCRGLVAIVAQFAHVETPFEQGRVTPMRRLLSYAYSRPTACRERVLGASQRVLCAEER